MKFNDIKGYVKSTISIILVVLIGISFYFCLQNLGTIVNSINRLKAILAPIFYGIAIAYVLSPLCNSMDNYFRKILLKHVKDPKNVIKISNTLSTFLSFTIFLLILVLLFSLIIPQLIFTVSTMIETLPENMERVFETFQQISKDNKFITSKVGMSWTSIISYLGNFLQNSLLPNLNHVISGVSIGVAQVVREMSNLVIGLVVSVYCLSGRKNFARQTKKVLYACFGEGRARFIISKLRFVDKAFSEFISGKLVEALVVGVACFIGMSLIGSQYTMLVSVIVGVTNLIPFFGPFIGGIPSAFIILFESPVKCLYFIIFLIILMQVDANILGPKILSSSTGLTGFWIIFSIILFGGLFGIVGMIIGIPIFSVIYRMGGDLINYMIDKRKKQN